MNHSVLKLMIEPRHFKTFKQQLRSLWEVVKEFAPYVAIELILPGGTLLAIMCWFYRKKHSATAAAR
jgi:hypothetical protein